MIYRLTIFLLLLVTAVSAQSVRFVETDLETAISMAESQKKNLFIDTYTKYCKPCKRMEIEFSDPELANYFNKNFVNVRVNMEGDRSEAFQNAYQVVFLPTMIFASQQGGQRMKIDHLVSSRDLLIYAKHINGDAEKAVTSSPTPPSTPHKVVSSPQPAKTKVITTPPTPVVPDTKEIIAAKPTTVITKPAITPSATDISVSPSEGKILYVMGQDADNLPPEILKEEAYFRMQLMDGSHHSAAKKYLATQEDWSTEENIRFIYDFINDSRSEEFLFLLDNRSAFDTTIGKEQIAQTITILVNKELERGYPRPDFERAKKLYTYTSPKDATTSAAIYQMNTFYEAGKLDQLLTFGESYIEEDKMTAEILYRYSSTLAQQTKSKKAFKKSLALAERAVDLENSAALYHYNCAQLCVLLKDKKKAAYYLGQAQAMANEDADMVQKISELTASLKQL